MEVTVNTSSNTQGNVSTDNLYGDDVNDYYDINIRFISMLTNPHDVIALVISMVAISLNLLVLASLHLRVKNTFTPHYRFIISLACSDVLVGLSVMLHKINHVLNPIYRSGGYVYQHERLVSRCTYLAFKTLNTIGLNVTLMNLVAMAVDLYVAIMKPLKYPVYMRRSRVITGIIVVWTLSLILGFSDFLSALATEWQHLHSKYGFNYCEIVWMTRYQEEYTVLAVAPVCFCIMLFIYIRIYIKIRRHRIPGIYRSVQSTGRKTRQALITTLLNLGTFTVTWLPLCLFQVILLIKVHKQPDMVYSNMEALKQVDQYLMDLLIVNAILDSVVYTVRIKEVKEGMYGIITCRNKNGISRNMSVSSAKETSFASLSLSRRWNSLREKREDTLV